MTLYVKNMVCNRCKMVVRAELEKLGLKILSIELGKVEIVESLTQAQKQIVNEAILPLGFQVIDDKKSRLIENIKNLIIELVHQKDSELSTNLSDFLSSRLYYEYSYLSKLFSEVEGVSIEKYFIAQKIERVKELLVYDELSLSEIAFQLHYSSVAHLSNQFKKVTGLTPSYFKNLKNHKRTPLDEV